MFLEVFCEDEDVIQVNDNLSFIDELPENFIHHPLEGGRRVAETKEHDSGLKQAPVGPEGGFPLISLLDTNMVVSISHIDLREDVGIAETVKKIINSREGIPVFLGYTIQGSVINTEP